MPRWFLSLGLLVPLVVGCDGKKGERLSGGGSSFVDPILQKWSSEYNKATGVQIDYSKSGSSDGIKQMTEKNLDFGCSDAPMKKNQLDAAREKGGDVIHVPLVMGGVAAVYNVPNVADLKLTGPVIADIYLGKIKKWNDEPIATLNPGAQLPDLAIVPVYRAEGSGTSNIFTEYLSKVHPEFARRVGDRYRAEGLGRRGQPRQGERRVHRVRGGLLRQKE
jgi:phosphate transport system substrate-binding protein